MVKVEEMKKTNEVGAEEVNSYVPPTLTFGQKLKRALFGKRMMSIIWALIRSVLLIGICYLIIYPMLITLITSFMTSADVYDPTVILIPRTLNINTYIVMWKFVNIPDLKHRRRILHDFSLCSNA